MEPDRKILSKDKNPTVLIEAVTEKPEDYDTGNWIKVVNKKRLKREKRIAAREKDEKINELKRLREKKIEERKNAPLWYNEESWQYKVLNNKYKFEDGISVVEKYKLEELVQMYSEARNNYRKNGITGKLLRILTNAEWEKIKDEIIEN